jgi:hypothetical protein
LRRSATERRAGAPVSNSSPSPLLQRPSWSCDPRTQPCFE